MTEQELKKKIIKFIADNIALLDCQSDCPDMVALNEELRTDHFCNDCFAGQILDLFKKAGYVRLDDDQSLPFVPEWKLALKTGCFARKEAHEEMIQQGWRKVELEESSVIENRISNNEC